MKQIVVSILIALLCLSFTTISAEVPELGGIRITYIEIDDGVCIIGIENIGYQNKVCGILEITTNNTLQEALSISIRNKDRGYYNEYQIDLDDSCILGMVSKDENNRITSRVSLDYDKEENTYIYIELYNVDGYTTTLALHRPISTIEEDWLPCT